MYVHMYLSLPLFPLSYLSPFTKLSTAVPGVSVTSAYRSSTPAESPAVFQASYTFVKASVTHMESGLREQCPTVTKLATKARGRN